MSKKPNIVVIMTDQQRADVSVREGFPLDTTPFLDSLAAQGTSFNHAYTATPACAPARVSMLTGRFPSATRVRENRGVEYATYEQDLIDVAEQGGYTTAMVGKNHSHLTKERVDHFFPLGHDVGYGTDTPRTEEEKAFDQWIRELNHATSMEPTPFPVECQGPYRAVSNAQQWIRAQKEQQPFLIWLSFAEPHNPYQVPEPYFSMFPPEDLQPLETDESVLSKKGFKWELTRKLGEYYYPKYQQEIDRARSNYYGMLRLIDDQVKRFVTFLEEEGLKEDTIIVFMSDHGDFVGEYGLVRKGPELPEVLMRVPMFFVGPNIQVNKDPHPAHVSLVDVLPTICEAVGAHLPKGAQGRSLWPLLTGEKYPVEEFASVYAEQGYGGLHYTSKDVINFDHCNNPGPVEDTFDEMNTYSQSGTMRMVRKGEWKLVYDMQGRGQLYHLPSDPYELNNLYGSQKYSRIEKEMLKELLTWTLRMQDPLPYPKDKYIMKTDPRNYWTPYSGDNSHSNE